jgi:uncharacterized protein YndB with AHSA1/START domain
VNPELLCRFWLDGASAPLSAGAVVQWRFKVPGVSDVVTVTDFEPPRRLGLRFSDGGTVVLHFDFHLGGATRVSVECPTDPDTVEGYSIVLCDLKTMLENGRSANLVRDKAELIAHRRSQTG